MIKIANSSLLVRATVFERRCITKSGLVVRVAVFPIISHSLSSLAAEPRALPSHDGFPEFQEELLANRFGKQVSLLCLCIDGLDVDFPFDVLVAILHHPGSEEMILQVDVLGAWAHLWYSCHL